MLLLFGTVVGGGGELVLWSVPSPHPHIHTNINVLHLFLHVLCAQGALEDLDCLPELTPSAVLLKCRISILLADATNSTEGIIHPQMVLVFEGLQKQLKEQASGATHHTGVATTTDLYHFWFSVGH